MPKYRCPHCNSFVKKEATFCYNCDEIIDGPVTSKKERCPHSLFDIVVRKDAKVYLRCHSCKKKLPFFLEEE